MQEFMLTTEVAASYIPVYTGPSIGGIRFACLKYARLTCGCTGPSAVVQIYWNDCAGGKGVSISNAERYFNNNSFTYPTACFTGNPTVATMTSIRLHLSSACPAGTNQRVKLCLWTCTNYVSNSFSNCEDNCTGRVDII